MTGKINLSDCVHEDLPIGDDDIVLVAKIKNEITRIPFFMQYYRLIGVKYFIFIDNDSSDGTQTYLSEQENTKVFHTTEPLSNEHLWMKKVLDTFCVDRWSIVVDLDELFCFPYIENTTIGCLTKYLDLIHSNAIQSLLLDMYPTGTLSSAVIGYRNSPLTLLRFFDRDSHFIQYNKYYGGVRGRVFGVDPCLTKYPLIKYEPSMIIGPGMHSVKNIVCSDLSTALLHCKFDSDFREKVDEAVSTKVHWNNSEEYVGYQKKYKNGDVVLFSKDLSVEYMDSKTLIEGGIIRSASGYDDYRLAHAGPKVSLIICTYGESVLPLALLESIKVQTFKDFEVIVVDNNPTPLISHLDNIRCKIVHEKNSGLSYARNKGVESSSGEFVVFVDSDVVLDGKCLENLLVGADKYNSDLLGARIVLGSAIGDNLTRNERRFLSELIYPEDIEFVRFPKYIIGACMMFRRRTFMKYGLFLTNLGRKGLNLLSGEETEFIKRIVKYGGKVSYINDSVCTHNINPARARFGYLLKRAFWQGVTDHIIDNLFDESASRKHRIIGSNARDTILNVSRLIGYKSYRSA